MGSGNVYELGNFGLYYTANPYGMYNTYPSYDASMNSLGYDVSGYDRAYAYGNNTGSIYGYGYGGECYDYTTNPYLYGGAGGYYDPITGPGFDQDKFRENMNDTQQFYTQYNNQQIHNQRSVEIATNAAMEDIKHAALVVKDKVAQNEQEQIIPAFIALKDAVRRAYQNDESGIELTEDEIQARALTHYQEATGQDLIKDIRENGHSSFMSGLINSVSFGLFSDNCPEDTVADITGQEAGKEEKTMNRLGKVTGAAGTGAAIGAGIGSVVPIVGTGVCAAIGGIIGGIVGLFT